MYDEEERDRTVCKLTLLAKRGVTVNLHLGRKCEREREREERERERERERGEREREREREERERERERERRGTGETVRNVHEERRDEMVYKFACAMEEETVLNLLVVSVLITIDQAPDT